MLPRFHLVTDLLALDRAGLACLLDVPGSAGDVGVDAVQVRAKHAIDREVGAWTRELVTAVRPRGTRVIVNDRVDLALAARPDGVHRGHDDLPKVDAPSLAPAGFLVEATCRGPEHARQAEADGADHAGVGPVHVATTKPGLPGLLGLDVLTATARVLPTIAIGGITAARMLGVMARGAHGVAVVAAVWEDPDPPRAAREIAELVHAA